MSTLTIAIDDNIARLTGPLNRNSVASLNPKSPLKMVNQSALEVNLQGVSIVDTAGLAWLLYLIECANKTKCQLTFAHMPDDLLKLAKLSAVDEYFTS